MGHPVHVILIHFPTALYPFSLVLDILSLFEVGNTYIQTSQLALLGGLSFSILAMIFGVIDLLRINTKEIAFDITVKHSVMNFIWFTLFLILFLVRWKGHDLGVIHLSLSCLGNIGLFFSNYLGGELVFKHQIGREER